jgi:hypothetical protein
VRIVGEQHIVQEGGYMISNSFVKPVVHVS